MPKKVWMWNMFWAVATFVVVMVLATMAGLERYPSMLLAAAVQFAVIFRADQRVVRDEVVAALAAHRGEYLDAKMVACIIRAIEGRKVSVSSVAARLEELECDGRLDFVRSSTSEATTYSYCLRSSTRPGVESIIPPHPAI